MEKEKEKPRYFNILKDEAVDIHHSPFGSTGNLFTGEGIEVVWVKKQSEEVEPGWFSQPMVDLILVVQGSLKVEFERTDLEPRVLETGEMVTLPPNTRCRAYRWPRDAEEGTVFLAVYPVR